MHKRILTRKRTWEIPGALYYVTCVVRGRRAIFAVPENMTLLRTTLHRVQKLYPFRMLGYAFMPDHVHMLIALEKDVHITKLMQSLQRNYTRNHKKLHHIKTPLSLWQRGFWEHIIWDQNDFADCLRYIHNNPRHHGLVADIREYPHTSYRAYCVKDEAWRTRGPEIAAPSTPSRWERFEPTDVEKSARPMRE